MRAIGPTWETGPNGLAGQAGTRPNVGLRPGRPQNAHGIRIEPPPSVPSASGTIPDASAAELPPLEPPAVVAGSHGLRVTPVSALSVTPFQPSSGVVVLPGSTAPERRSEATTGASSSHGPAGSIAREPRSVGQPRVTSRSLIATGTPSSGPAGSPRLQRASEARASACAASASTRQNALTVAVERLDPLEHGGGDLDRGELARPVGGDELRWRSAAGRSCVLPGLRRAGRVAAPLRPRAGIQAPRAEPGVLEHDAGCDRP